MKTTIQKPNAILDTCVLVDILHKTKNIEDKISNLDITKCAITDLTVFELFCGAQASNHPQENMELIQQLVDSFEIIPTRTGYELAAKEKIRLRKQGKTIEDIDLLIGCTSMSSEIPIVTGNQKHLGKIHGIQIIPW